MDRLTPDHDALGLEPSSSPRSSSKSPRKRKRKAVTGTAPNASTSTTTTLSLPGSSSLTEDTVLSDSDDKELSVTPTPHSRARERTPVPTKKPPAPPPPPDANLAIDLAEKVNGILLNAVWTVLDVSKGVLHVLSFAFVLLRTPIVLILICYILLRLAGSLVHSVEHALAPICNAPIIGPVIPFCSSFNTIQDTSARINDYQQLLKLQSRLESVAELSVDHQLFHRVRSSEVAMRDLTTQLQLSQLASKDLLIDKMELFIAEAKDASRGLMRLGSKVGGSIDTILAIDDYVVKRLEKIENAALESSTSVADLVLGRTPEAIRRRHRTELVESFERASDITAQELQRLMTEAEVVLVLMDRLDAVQRTLHSMILTEQQVVDQDRDDLMAQLWTILGKNRRELKTFTKHRDLLSEMAKYRAQASDRIRVTIDQLRLLSEDLFELRDRVAKPALIGVDGDSGIPLEAHLESVRRGVAKIHGFRKEGLEREDRQLRNLLAEPLPAERQVGAL